MGETANRLIAFDLDLIDPFHVLDIEHGDVLVVLLVLEIWGAEVAAEEDQQHLVDHTGLLLFFGRVLARYVGHSCPLLLGYVEGVVILGYGFVVSSVDDDFVAVGDHVVEGAAVGQGLLRLSAGELHVDLGERVVELAPAVALIGWYIPPKM